MTSLQVATKCEPLALHEEGILLGALLAPDAAARALECLTGGGLEQVHRELTSLAAKDRSARLGRLRELTKAIRRPGPRRINLLHPTRMREAIEGVHPAVVEALRHTLPEDLVAALPRGEGQWRLAPAVALRLVQDRLVPFEVLDGVLLGDEAIETWLISEHTIFHAALERFGADVEVPESSEFAGALGLSPEAIRGASAAFVALESLGGAGVGMRLLLRLPRGLDVFVESDASASERDDSWVAALRAAVEVGCSRRG